MSAATDRVHVLGVRHHGPGSARSVRLELERIEPSAVLVEGPADADPLIGFVADSDLTPPAALLGYATDAPSVSAFWPFAVFSPEWQALRWAAERGVPARFCDLPAAAVLADRDGPIPDGDAGQDSAPTGDAGDLDPSRPSPEAVRADPVATLAETAGYDDPERWWDDVIEARLDGTSPFAALTEAMGELRAHLPAPDAPEALREARREAHMRQAIRAALKTSTGPLAVVCGAWHAPALAGPLPAAAADAALLKGVARRKTTVTWVPWTHSRLAYASGYGAGVASPGWYHHLFTAPDRVITRWLTKVAGVLRANDLPVSSAHVIEAVRLADTLAALRGRPLAGLEEVTEATRSVLCEGDETATRFVQSALVVGEQLGSVPETAPSVPFEVDLRAQLRRLRLKFEALERTVALDLRKATDRARSVLFHRLAVLGIGWAAPAEDTVRSRGTFRETWTLQWRPEYAVSVVDAALWGTTVAAAADARLVDHARTAPNLAGVARAVEVALLGELGDALPIVLDVLDARAALDLDVAELMAAVPALVRAVRYGDVRGTDSGSLTQVVAALTIRICAGLPGAVTSLSDDAAVVLRDGVDALHDALTLHAQTDPAPKDRWLRALADVADRRDVQGLLAGRVVRLLVDAAVLAQEEAATRFAAHLSVGVAPADKAAWAEGFLSGSGLVLVHDAALLSVLDDWVCGLAADDFLDVLPLLRRAFGTFSAAERSHVADAVRQLTSGGVARAVDTEPVDPVRAAGVVRTVAAILGGGR